MSRPRTHDPNAVFAFIIEFMTNSRGAAPTRRQIGDHFDASTSVVTSILRKLEQAGYIYCVAGNARGIQVSNSQWSYTGPMTVDTEQYSGVTVAGAVPYP